MSFLSKILNITVINSYLQKLSIWVTAKSNISTRIDCLLPTSVTFFRAITMCSTDCAYDKSAIIIIGDVYCPNKKCLCKLCLHKKTFQSLGRSAYQCPQCASACVRCAIFLLNIKQISFSCRLVQGFAFLKRIPIQIKMILEMSIVQASIVSTERNANPLVVCNNSEIHLWFWKVWSLVVHSQSSFHVTGARKDDKNRQNTLLLC